MLYLFANLDEIFPSTNPEFRKPFLDRPYWGDDELRDTYAKYCANNDARYCSSLAYLAEKHEGGKAALDLYQKACRLGDKYGCDRAKDVSWWATRTDPYKDVRIRTLSNGVRVFSLQKPDAKDFMAAIQIDAGFSSEKIADIGVAHLTEHLMFRQEQFDGKVGRLHAAESRGSRMNGATMDSSTLYYIQSPDVTSTWSTQLLVSMFDKPKFVEHAVEKAKDEIVLERQLRFPWVSQIIRQLFWFSRVTRLQKSDFGTPIIDRSLDIETTTTAKLHAADVSRFFKSHYTGDNTAVFLVGNYDAKEIDPMIDKVMSKLHSNGDRPLALQTVHPKKQPSYALEYGNSWYSPRIIMGTKFWNAKAEDVVALDVYAEYVASRLMFELREKGANTYTASGRTSFNPYGMSYIDLEVKPGDLFRNTYLLRNAMAKEANAGELKDWQIQEAIWLYHHHYRPGNADIGQQLSILQKQSFFQRAFGANTSPFQVLNHLKTQDVRRVLKKHYGSNQSYLTITNPYGGPHFLGALITVSFLLPIAFVVYRRKRLPPLDAELRQVYAIADPILSKMARFLFALQVYNIFSIAEALFSKSIPGWKIDLFLFCLVEMSVSLIKFGGFAAFALWLFVGRVKECRVSKNNVINMMGWGLRRDIPLQDIVGLETTSVWKILASGKDTTVAVSAILRFNAFGPGLLVHCSKSRNFFVAGRGARTIAATIEDQKKEAKPKVETNSIEPSTLKVA